MVNPAKQDVQGDLVGRLLPLGSLDQGDHAVDEAGAGLGRDPHHDAVGQDSGPAGDARAVAAGLSDDRGRLAGDGGFVHRGDAFDDLAVAWDQLAGGDDAQVAHVQVRRGHLADGPVRIAPMSHRLPAGPAQCVGLGLAPPFGHRLGEVGEQHREPQPDGHGTGEHGVGGGRGTDVDEEQDGGEHGTYQHDEHHRVAGFGARVQLDDRVDQGPSDDGGLEQPGRLAVGFDPGRELGFRLGRGWRRGEGRSHWRSPRSGR